MAYHGCPSQKRSADKYRKMRDEASKKYKEDNKEKVNEKQRARGKLIRDQVKKYRRDGF